MMNDYGTSNPERLAMGAGLTVSEDDWRGLDGLVMLGTYDGDSITLYREQIRAVAANHGVPEFQLVEGTLAHELGHHYVPVVASEARGVTRWMRALASVLGVKYESKAVREAVANGFCFTLLERRFETSPLFNAPELLTEPSLD